MSEFKREVRYTVIKHSQLTESQMQYLKGCIFGEGIPTVKAVVVEADWPEYQPVWQMIEDRVTGAPVEGGKAEYDALAAAMTTNQTIDGVPRDQMISFPRELNDEMAEILAEKARVRGAGAFDIWELLCARFGTETAVPPQGVPVQDDRETLIGYGRSSGLDEASTLCTRLAYAAYYPPGTRFKAFTPKAQKALGDLLIKAANEIASLPGGPYERFKARQAVKAESAKSQ